MDFSKLQNRFLQNEKLAFSSWIMSANESVTSRKSGTAKLIGENCLLSELVCQNQQQSTSAVCWRVNLIVKSNNNQHLACLCCLPNFSPCKVAVVDGTIISPLPHFNRRFRHERCERTTHFIFAPKPAKKERAAGAQDMFFFAQPSLKVVSYDSC